MFTFCTKNNATNNQQTIVITSHGLRNRKSLKHKQNNFSRTSLQLLCIHLLYVTIRGRVCNGYDVLCKLCSSLFCVFFFANHRTLHVTTHLCYSYIVLSTVAGQNHSTVFFFLLFSFYFSSFGYTFFCFVTFFCIILSRHVYTTLVLSSATCYVVDVLFTWIDFADPSVFDSNCVL